MKIGALNIKDNLIKKILIVFLICCVNTFYVQGQNYIIKDENFVKGNALKFHKRDSAIFFYNKGYELRLSKGDTLEAITNLIALSEIHGHNLNYGKSYDGYWTALLLAEKSKDSYSKSKVYLGLGWLYSYYKRNQNAFEYFKKSLKIRKQLNNQKLLHINNLSENYFSLACYYRGNKDFVKVGLYLDSIVQIKNKDATLGKSYYFEAEYGYLLSLDGKYEEAIKKLNAAKTYFEVHSPSYLVIIHAFLGKVFFKKGNNAKAEEHFKKSLSYSKQFKSHLGHRIEIYNLLYQVSLKTNKSKEAIHYLLKEKELNDKIFGIKSDKNSHLFEIKDTYRLEKENQVRLINQQKIKDLEYEESIWFLQSVVLVITIVFLLFYGFAFFQKIRTKHKNEKILLKERQNLELKRQKEIIEIKNKELTESALRIIEKDEFIANIKKKLSKQKDKVDVNVIKRILRSIQGNPTSNWAEFEARFTTINQSFYNNLKTKFPNLRQTDLKICALVKLNFSSKDMSKLIGISIDSVNTSRSRLRKKLGLSREQNLEEFINNL